MLQKDCLDSFATFRQLRDSRDNPFSAWFGRAFPADAEPGLEEPCPRRRGRIQELDGLLLHFCIECGRFGAFGFGVSLRTGRSGTWYCSEHRPRGHAR
jgi:hypothetical protein